MSAGTAAASAAELDRLLTERHSCRAFLPDPVPEDVVRSVLRSAQRSASWCNAQPWRTVVLAGEETEALRRRLLSRVAGGPGRYDIDPPGAYDGVLRDRRRAAGFALYESVGISRDDHAGRMAQAMENYRFFGAPHVAVVMSDAALGPYGYVDCGAYLATFLLAARAHGLATIAQGAIAGYADVLRDHLGLPDGQHVVCAVSFGYGDDEHPVNAFRTERAEVDEVADLRGFA